MEVITNTSLVDEESKLKRRASEKEWIANKKRALSSPMADSPVATATTNGISEDIQKQQSTRDDDAFPDQEKVLVSHTLDCRFEAEERVHIETRIDFQESRNLSSHAALSGRM